jgi:phosphoribosylanthranilate isomerase
VGRAAEVIRELSAEASGVISPRWSRRSVSGSTLRQWNTAMTPPAVMP